MDIYKHLILAEKLKGIIPLLEQKDLKYFESLLNNSLESIKYYNKKNKSIIDATPTELGRFLSTCKKVIRAALSKSLFVNEKEYYNLYEHIENTNFSDVLINSKIKLSRKCNYYNMSPLEKVINERIKLEIVKEFKEKNHNILIK